MESKVKSQKSINMTCMTSLTFMTILFYVNASLTDFF